MSAQDPNQEIFPYTFKIGGEAGFGVMSAGAMFSKIMMRSGYYVFDYTEYPSLIRGGHNVMQTTVSPEPVYAQYAHTNFLIALNQETIDLHVAEMVDGGVILYDADHKIDVQSIPKNIYAHGIPLTQVVRESNGSMVMRNTAALSAALTLIGANKQHLADIISEEFKHKNPQLIEINMRVCDYSEKYVLENYKENVQQFLPQRDVAAKQILITGNEAVAFGALVSGMNFASIYPMTPTSNILHNLAPHQEDLGFIYKQPEDEISAINMALGAAFAGARSMVATSGGGFCLMTEGYGLAGITELPVVIVEGMRGAPATGLPTWTEQGDLQFVLSAHQGDFPRIVLAAGDINECFDLATKAFNLAEKYQTPVVLLVDKFLCESHQSVLPFDASAFEINRGKLVTGKVENYQRYAPSEDGISPRSIPGVGNHIMANSDEHDVTGYSNEERDNRNLQMAKRMQKLITCAQQDLEKPQLYGDENAEITLVSWGSNKGPILEALNQTNKANFLHITWMNPFPVVAVTKVLKKAKHIINIECNYSAQMGRLITEQTGVMIEDNLLKYDGRPFYPEEILAKINDISQGKQL